MLELNTFSIVARCPRTAMLGVAVSTAVPAVGALCPFVLPGVGAVSTQSWVNPYLAIEALDLMRGGATASEALGKVLERDDAAQLRQVGVVDSRGRAAAWTGDGCTPWCGHRTGDGFAVQGNMLVGEDTVLAMARSFESTEPLDLAERMMLALEAGQAAGGDKRGKQSASIKIFGQEEYAWLDLRVDEHPYPVAELRRILCIARLQLLPFVEGMPRRGAPAGALPESTAQMLLRPPPSRPGGGGSG